MIREDSFSFGGERAANKTTGNYQLSPRVTPLTGGGHLVVWTSAGQDWDGYGIYSQQYDALGAPVGGESLVNTTTAASQRQPAVSGLKDGGYVVAWTNEVVGFTTVSALGITAQQFNASGRKVGAEIHVNTYPDSGQSSPRIAGLADGSYVIVWTSRNGRRRSATSTDRISAPPAPRSA